MRRIKKMFGDMRETVTKFVANARRTVGATCKAISYAITIASATVLAGPRTAFATSEEYNAPLNNLATILKNIAAAAGVVLIVYGAIRFAIAFQKMDQNGEHSAIYTIIAGGVLVAIKFVVDTLNG